MRLNQPSEEVSNARVSEHDVRLAYELLLGRQPESEDVVREYVKSCQDVAALRDAFLRSYEFWSNTGGMLGVRPLDWPPLAVEVDASPDAIMRLFRHIESNWSELGRLEPHWSVLTHERFKSASISEEENIAAFFRSGHDAVRFFRVMADRSGIDLDEYQRVFELGCGVGRITAALAESFPSVCAADISAPHLEIASERLRGRIGDGRVEWLLLKSPGDLLAVRSFDVFYSFIVLQHNPPPLIKMFLKNALSNLRSGGIAYFQLSSYALGYCFRTEEYLQQARSDGRIEMHVLPQAELWQILRDAQCDLLEVREDTATGLKLSISNTILARKR